MANSRFRMPALSEQQVLDNVQLRQLALDDKLLMLDAMNQFNHRLAFATITARQN